MRPRSRRVSQEDFGSCVSERKSPRRLLSRRTIRVEFHLVIRAVVLRTVCREGQVEARRPQRTCCSDLSGRRRWLSQGGRVGESKQGPDSGELFSWLFV